MNDFPVPNVDLLQATLNHVRNNPEHWDQATWICGSTACFAGRACLLSEEIEQIDEEFQDVWFKDGRVMHVQEAARMLLGLTPEQSELLFGSNTGLHWLEHYVGVIIEESRR